MDVSKLGSDLSWIEQQNEKYTSMVTDRTKSVIVQLKSAFDQVYVHDRLTNYVSHFAEACAQVQKKYDDLREGMERHQKAHLLVCEKLPIRGWYLCGHEPCTLSLRLADAIRANDWDKVDQEIMEHLPVFDVEAMQEWFRQEGIPDYCSNRFCSFIAHDNEGNYEEATFLGVPLIDEIAQHLYGGKSFTTKRNKATKPELAMKSGSGADLGHYWEPFVQEFGSLQLQVDFARLSDENYWNRHAIVHGKMRRAMGKKDSAKCLMAIAFVICARKEEENTEESST